MSTPQNKLVDGFARVVGYDDGLVWVDDLPYATSKSAQIGIQIKETPNTARYADTPRFVGCIINQAMRTRIAPGQYLMLQGLAVPTQHKLIDGEKTLVNWIATANQDARWRQTGIVTYSGPIYADPEKAHLNRIASVGIWRPKAMTLDSAEFAEYTVLMDERAKRINASLHSTQTRKEILPRLGVMIRAERAGELQGYTRPAAQASDVNHSLKTFAPLTGDDVMRLVDSQFKRWQSRFGSNIDLSVMGWSAIQAGQSVKPFSNYEWSAAFTPVRETGMRPDRFGGHMACKANSALDLTSTRELQGEPVLQVYVNRASSSGRRDITAFAVPSAYSGQRLIPGDEITAIATKKPLYADPQSNQNVARQTPATALSGQGLVDLVRDARGNLVACLRSESGEIHSFTRDELIRRLSLYSAKGLDARQERLALDAIDNASRCAAVPSDAPTRQSSDKQSDKQQSAQIIPLKPRQ